MKLILSQSLIKLHKYISASLVVILLQLFTSYNMFACHSESDSWVSTINNGNGTYTVNFVICVEATCERSSGVRITLGGVNILSASPASLTGNAGTIFSGIPVGGTVDYGTPFINSTLWINNTGGGCSAICYNMSFVVNGIPTSLNHSGTEYTIGYCSTAPIGAAPPPSAVPTLGEWGLIIFALSLVMLATVYLRRRALSGNGLAF